MVYTPLNLNDILSELDKVSIDSRIQSRIGRGVNQGFSVDTNVISHRIGYKNYTQKSYIRVSPKEVEYFFNSFPITVYLFTLEELFRRLKFEPYPEDKIEPLNRSNMRFVITPQVSRRNAWGTLSRLEPDLITKLRREEKRGLINYTDALLLGFSHHEKKRIVSYDQRLLEVGDRLDLDIHDTRLKGVLPKNYVTSSH